MPCITQIPGKLRVKHKWNQNEQSLINELCLLTMVYQAYLSSCSNILYTTALHKVVIRPCFVNSWAFRWCSFHTQSWFYHLLPMNLFTHGMFQTGVSGASHNYPRLWLSPNLLETCCSHQFQNANTFTKINYVYEETLNNCLCSAFNVKMDQQIITFCLHYGSIILFWTLTLY